MPVDLPPLIPTAPGVVRVLGIDPGSQRTGVGIIDVAADGRLTHVHHQPLVLLDAASFPLRLRKLLDGLWELIARFAPDEVAVEQVFLSNNAMSAIKLGQARGAAIAACVARDLPVSEYAAKEIKLGIVGSGGADKKQVQHMVGVMLGLQGSLQADAADALAVAITHAHVRASAERIGVATRAAWGRKGRARR